MAFVAMSPDVLITIKLLVGTENRRFKLPLRELGAHTLPDKVSYPNLPPSLGQQCRKKMQKAVDLSMI
jgi:hypothetical protein